MKIVLLFFSVAILCFAQLAFHPPVNRAGELAISYAEAFGKATLILEEVSSAYKFNKASLDTLKATLSNTRKAYKKIEFLLAYYYPEYTEEHINGAPVLRLERNDSRAVVMEPQGLQVLDELISTGETPVKIASTAQQLKIHYSVLLADFRTRTFNERDWYSAIRLQLVRIFAMGITGFDTPGSLNALEETSSSLTGIRNITEAIRPGDEIMLLLDSAIAYLQQPVSFNDFNRLIFLKQYINPLYTYYGTDAISDNNAWNNQSKNIFSEDFLNPYYYTELRKDDDNKTLRLLGKKLFYDPVLSSNHQLSCASCHNPSMAFTDGQPRSSGIVKDRPVQRNAPTLLNAVYADRYFYDLRAFSLEQQAEHVIFNQQEFNTAYEEIIKRLEGNKQYKQLFRQCFGKKAITRDHFSKALSSYVLSLRSFNSPFDQYVRGESATLDTLVQQGFNLFMGKAGCGTCHFAPTFAGLVPPLYIESESEILGVLQNPDARQKKADPDNGRLDNQLYSEMTWINEKSFKTTTVRNAALTAPYFHNGAYKTLEQVIDFYDHGGGTGAGLHIKNQTLPADSLHLTTTEKQALIAFIGALSDTTILAHIP
ncbi:cytochrome-c peroxidase [Chitinophaga sp. CF118]|uniref:cytochrome-c peroxidase n=1 Tax=Chitinophaga sp. CF118 TaxID=1884367 RepID=UPI0015A6F1E7|nr:cytochrome c peroxidase [Chitinophaga sp. CF118]